jgi:hypothetical protein
VHYQGCEIVDINWTTRMEEDCVKWESSTNNNERCTRWADFCFDSYQLDFTASWDKMDGYVYTGPEEDWRRCGSSARKQRASATKTLT